MNADTARARPFWRNHDERDLRFLEKLRSARHSTLARPDGLRPALRRQRIASFRGHYPGLLHAAGRDYRHGHPQFSKAKVIFLARDPVERAWSQISMSVRKGGIPAVRRQQIPLKLFVNCCIRCARAFASQHDRRALAAACRPQINLVSFFFDDLKNQPAEFRRSIIAFLGGDPTSNNRLRP